jgi:hypothetical protein
LFSKKEKRKYCGLENIGKTLAINGIGWVLLLNQNHKSGVSRKEIYPFFEEKWVIN